SSSAAADRRMAAPRPATTPAVARGVAAFMQNRVPRPGCSLRGHARSLIGADSSAAERRMHLVQDSGWPVLVATLLSAIVGIERQWRCHAAGLRTHMLVGIGAALATVAGRYGFSGAASNASPDRIAAQVISGVGFLGAG